MNNKTLDYLQRDLKFLGFGENSLLNDQLTEAFDKGEPAFELYHDAYYEDFVRVEAKLYFFTPKNTDNIVFGKYDAMLYDEKDPANDKMRTFFIFKGTGVTFKQAYNLLEGRAALVRKRDNADQIYSVWSQLDFNEKDETGNYRMKEYRNGFDLNKVLSLYSIRELRMEESKERLVAALERGNLEQITLEKDKPEKVYITTNPYERGIRILPLATRARKKKQEPLLIKEPGDPRAEGAEDHSGLPGERGLAADEDSELFPGFPAMPKAVSRKPARK